MAWAVVRAAATVAVAARRVPGSSRLMARSGPRPSSIACRLLCCVGVGAPEAQEAGRQETQPSERTRTCAATRGAIPTTSC